MSAILVFALMLAVPQASTQPSRAEVIAAEAARAATDEQLQLLVRAATTASPAQVAGVRALGRLERAELVTTLLPLLDAPQPPVRAEAANALAQSAGTDPAAVRRVRDGLMQRLIGEPDAEVRGALGAALGRLPTGPTEIAQSVERALVDITRRVETASRVEKQAAGGRIVGLTLTRRKETAVPLPALVGALRGLEAMARVKAREKQPFAPETLERLRAIVVAEPAAAAGRQGAPAREAEAAEARRLALLCLLPVGGVSADLATHAVLDPDVQVRRLAVQAAAAGRETVGRGLKDPAWLVRYEALRAYGRRFQAGEGCTPVVGAIADESAHVSLLAIDLLGNRCQAGDRAVERLVDLVAARIDGGAWHRPAHAIVALATASPEQARRYLDRVVGADAWQARMYGARAAAQLEEPATLRLLAVDRNANVREAAVAGLSKSAKHDADGIYIDALGSADFQLVMTAAGALAGTPRREPAVRALIAALSRLTALDSDPSRDPRAAVLERLQELGGREQAPEVARYLEDQDPRIAALAASVLRAWTGAPAAAAPRPARESAPPLTDSDLARLARTTVRVRMAGGGQFEIRLMVDLAPLSCARFVALASAGYYDGLTFHRVLPNFLIQGGSPGANEYSGDRRYMRDEPGRVSQVRGTVGTSTRGRDTGDAQIYINLVDTPRLDHEYSIFAEVSQGMDVVDRILEGDVMTKVEVVVK
jgi:cyclophilin family peptidyl-prolyl cis-trans isomerase